MQDKVVVVTGASSGIGAALGQVLSARGASVVLVARRQEALAAATARCGTKAHAITGDMTRRDEVRRVVTESLAHFGRIDAWVNNVGQGITRMPSQLTDEDLDLMLQVNVKSALYGMQEVLPQLKAQGKGQIVNISSLLGRVPYVPFRAAYTGAKHFLNALTANFRDELKTTHPGIVVSLVSPGVVRTEFGRNALHGGPDSRQLPESQSAEEVAEVIADVIATGRTDVYTRAGVHDGIVKYYDQVGQDP